MEAFTIVINCDVCGVPLDAGEGDLDPVIGPAVGEICIWTCSVCGREYVRREKVNNENEA